jgi:hypothetical protein
MADVSDEINAPIEVYADDTIIDGGIAAVPKMLLRFARHLDSDGARLNDRQVLLLIMVIALREDRNLRLSNLPMIAALSTLETDLAFLRKAGLVFTRRDYYPAIGGKPPRMRSQIWDIRSLHANLAHIQRLWFRRQSQKLNEWRSLQERGPAPVYEFPITFSHNIVVPQPVLEQIAAGCFFPVPGKWLKRVNEIFSPQEIAALKVRHAPTSSQTGSRLRKALPTARITGNRALETAPTASQTGDHLLTHPHLHEERLTFTDEEVFAHFAERKNQPYQATGNDRKALSVLREYGYSLAQIVVVIDEVFERGDNPKRFAYCARIVRDRPPACPPPPLIEPVSTPANAPDFPAELEAMLKVFAATDLPNIRRRVKAMADLCDPAARQHDSSGTQWLLNALERSIGKDDPLTYAAAILRSWMATGPDTNVTATSDRNSKQTRTTSKTPAQVRWNDAIDA